MQRKQLRYGCYFCSNKDEIKTFTNRLRKIYAACFLLDNSKAGELPRRKHTTYRTRRKFEIKKICVVILKYYVFCILLVLPSQYPVPSSTPTSLSQYLLT
jgi:hypothetical protein